MKTVAKADQPALFQDPNFKGTLYQLDEPVLDIPSVLTALATPWQHRIIHTANAEITWLQDDKGVQALQLSDELEITAQHIVLTAGEGNEDLLNNLGIKKPEMQRRPLQMVMCKAKDPTQSLPAIYAHSLGSGSKPIATITSHLDDDSNIVWYIGGNIAVNGVGKSFEQLTAEAEKLLHNIMPWYEHPELEWATHDINRAEPKQSALSRPDTAFVESKDNVHIAWPTKLALAPDLADKIIEKLKNSSLIAGNHKEVIGLPTASISPTLWNTKFK
jgi:hypothetical protein